MVVKVESEGELLSVMTKAKNNNVNYYLVMDAGRTQIPSGSKTVLAVGPGRESLVNLVTGSLKLM